MSTGLFGAFSAKFGLLAKDLSKNCIFKRFTGSGPSQGSPLA